MRRLLELTMAFALCVFIVMLFASAKDDDSIRPLLLSSVQIQADDGFGSGTAVSNVTYFTKGHTLVLTAAHVVDGAKGVVVLKDGNRYPSRVIAEDVKLDVALLDVPTLFPVIPIFYGTVGIGEREVAIGYPLAKSIVVTEGYFSGNEQQKSEQGEITVLQGSASVYPGNSGGGAFIFHDGEWMLCGIVQAMQLFPLMQLPAIATSINYSVPMSSVQEFLKENSL